MPQLSASLFAFALILGLSAPASAAGDQNAKASRVQVAEQGKSGASSDFEENRRVHAQKSKENNDKKGAE